jgi:hypothetical protein
MWTSVAKLTATHYPLASADTTAHRRVAAGGALFAFTALAGCPHHSVF